MGTDSFKETSQSLHSYHSFRDTKGLLDPIFQEFARFIFLKINSQTAIDELPRQFDLGIISNHLLDYFKQQTKVGLWVKRFSYPFLLDLDDYCS